ncbi:MAG: hypothetical protein IKU79_05215 [Bacteroidaceae bacterium]|jgi:hypothetical protein|nr:hypothetical protein [Bacteroidaceae bacterium]
MSDGNFNRALLPHTPYHSGLATGRMQMKMKAQKALQEILKTYYPHTTTQVREEIAKHFTSLLSDKQ